MARNGTLVRAVCVLVVGMGNASGAWADPGELFPEVKAYDQQVSAPVSKPQQAVAPPPVVAPAVIQPQAVAPAPPPAQAPLAPVKTVVSDLWSPYRARLMEPLMSVESKARFDRDYVPRLAAAFKDSKTGEVAGTLWTEAHGTDMADDLRRALMLHSLGLSIVGRLPLEDRATKAREVLPLLKEENLPVAQARADAVTELAFGALAKASDDLLALVVESQCKLARMQVQAGFPLEAKASIKAARDAYGYLQSSTVEQRDTVAEAGGWAGRDERALKTSTWLKKRLAKVPGDPAANTQLALLNLSLYGDVEQAATPASMSDHKEFTALAAAVKKEKDESKNQPGNIEAALAIGGALLDIADSGIGEPFDRYSISQLVVTRLAAATSGADLTAAEAERLRNLQSRAAASTARSGLKTPTFPALAELIAGGAEKNSAPAAKLVLFVENSASPVKYLKPTPTEETQMLGIEQKFIDDLRAKTGLKLAELQTAHCLVMTDCDASRYGYVRALVEAAYIAVAKLYDFPVHEDVFAAKLPIFLPMKGSDFFPLAGATGNNMSPDVTGFFDVNADGIGYIMIRQLTDQEARATGTEATTQSERSLVWNMFLAFTMRYRTNVMLPTWVMDGMAARVSDNFYHDSRRPARVRSFLLENKSIDELLKHTKSDFQSQSVCMTIVDTLRARDSRAFIKFIDKMKDGDDPEAALQKTYKWSYADLNQAWREWVSR